MSFIIKGGGAFIGTSIAGNIQSAAAPSFDPSSIGENLTLWLDERGQSESGNIRYWINQGSRTFTMQSDSAGSWPAFNETINGYPSITFNNSSPRWLVPNWVGPQQPIFSRDSYHAFAVLKYPDSGWSFGSSTFANNTFLSHTNAGFGFFSFRYRFDLSRNLFYSYQQGVGDAYGGDFVYSNDTVVYNTPVLVETWYDGTNLNVRYGDGPVYSEARNDLVNSTNTYNFWIGRDAAASTTGSLATVLIVSSALDPTTQNNVRQYLGNKYGVSY
jgi:hypothetical protein